MQRILQRNPILLVTILCVAGAHEARPAGVYVWTAASGNTWVNGIHWNNCTGTCYSPGSPGDQVFITGAQVEYDGNPDVSVGSVTLNNANVEMRQGNLGIGTLTGNGSVAVFGNSQLTLGQSLTNGAWIYLYNNLYPNGRSAPAVLQVNNGATIGPTSRVAFDSNGGPTLGQVSGATGNETLLNQGEISSPAQFWGLGTLANQGLLIPEGGATMLIQSTAFDNSLGTVQTQYRDTVRIESPTFYNYFNGTLTGGTYDSNGKIMLGGAVNTLGVGTTVTLRGGGAITDLSGANALSLDTNKGTLNITYGNDGPGKQSLNSSGLSNLGQVTVDGNSTLTSGSIFNAGGGSVLLGYGGVNNGDGFLNASSFHNEGVLQLAGSSALLANSDPTGSGTFENAGNGVAYIGTPGANPAQGVSQVIANSALVSGGVVDIESNGRLQVPDYQQTGGVLKLRGGVVLNTTAEISGGVVDGYGQFNGDLSNSGAVLQPDLGDLVVNGNYTQGADGTLDEALGSGDILFAGLDAKLDGTFIPGAVSTWGIRSKLWDSSATRRAISRTWTCPLSAPGSHGRKFLNPIPFTWMWLARRVRKPRSRVRSASPWARCL
jgi:hypothetical protein